MPPYSTIGTPIYEQSIAALQEAMASEAISAVELVQACLDRIAAIDHAGPSVRSVLEINPDALDIATTLDRERADGHVRGLLHGIPILLKDNIDTADNQQTTAGSLALVGISVAEDATVAARLRAAGAVLLGKTNMSEWANFRSAFSASGWSARGGQTRNPHVLDRTPSGSSSGSAAAVAASLCTVAIGTETDGSIISPSAVCGVVGIKPTVGLTSRAGVIPISATQDTIGPHARSVADAAVMLSVIAGRDIRDLATLTAPEVLPNYVECLDPNGLRAARIGVLPASFNPHPKLKVIFDQALALMQAHGAVLTTLEVTKNMAGSGAAERTILTCEFKDGLRRYLASRIAGKNSEVPRSLADLIAFNNQHAVQEMPFFEQETFLAAEATHGLDSEEYRQALVGSRDAAQTWVDQTLASHRLDAIVMLSDVPAPPTDWLNGDPHIGGSTGIAARAGYPLITVPAGFIHGLPIGISFMGTAWSEAALIRLGYAFEQASHARRPPEFLGTVGEHVIK
jgi:amidase